MVLVIVILFYSLLVFLCVALGVGFYTLMERKVLAYIQLRKGPNKVGFMGLPQPLADALKLFSKENPKVTLSFKFLYIVSPVLSVFVMFGLWILYVSDFSSVYFKLGVLFFIVLSSLNVFTVLLSGWSSNSKYSLIGSVRAVAQTISYEISMSLVLLSVLVLSLSFSMYGIFSSQVPMWFSFVLLPIFLMWLVSSLAETNRAPFDLAEGESELVSGFNIEYGGSEFAFLFIAEYGSILLISMLTSCMFFSGFMVGLSHIVLIKVIFVSYFFLWVRGSYPRMRYDVLMSLTWKSFLTLSILCMLFLLCQHS